MDTYMVDVWFFLFFFFFLTTTSFHFISILLHTNVNGPCGSCHWPPTISFFTTTIVIIPSPMSFRRTLRTIFIFYFTVVRRYAIDVFFTDTKGYTRRYGSIMELLRCLGSI